MAASAAGAGTGLAMFMPMKRLRRAARVVVNFMLE